MLYYAAHSDINNADNNNDGHTPEKCGAIFVLKGGSVTVVTGTSLGTTRKSQPYVIERDIYNPSEPPQITSARRTKLQAAHSRDRTHVTTYEIPHDSPAALHDSPAADCV